MLEITSYIFLGAFAGILAGLFGIGGGVIIVPGLAYLFGMIGMPNTAIMHMATSTSLTTIILTTLAVVIAQQRQHTIVWKTFWNLVPGMIIGVLLGTGIVDFLSTHVLKMIFGVFLILVAGYLFFSSEENTKSSPFMEKRWVQLIIGFIIGVLAGLLGVGGGIITVPALLRMNLTMHQASATSSACAFLLGIIGTINLIIMGTLGWGGGVGVPSGSTSYIYWPAVLGVSLASVLFAPFGTILANRLPASVLKYIFAVFLLGISVDFLFFS